MAVEPLGAKAARAIELATARSNIWEGAVRSSKTVSSLLAWIEFTLDTGPAGNLVMVGRTERTLKRNIIDTLVDWLGTRQCRYVAGSGELWLCGRRIYIAGANDERAADKIRGLTLAGAYVDEASVVPEAFYAMLMSRLSVPGARLYATTNPDNPSHWLMRDWLSRPTVHLTGDGRVTENPDGLDLARFSFRLPDNPHLSPEYVASLSEEFTGLWRRRFIDGEWVISEGAIFDSFDPAAHVVTELPVDDAGRTDIAHWLVAADYGTVNPFAALLIGVDDQGGVWVTSEYRHDSRRQGRQLTDAEYSTAMRDWLTNIHPAMIDRLEAIHIDPSAASFQAQLHRDGWAGVRGADNTVLDGIRDTAGLLTAGRLHIHTDCQGLIDELPGYVWDPDAARKGQDKPLKVNDHSCDALRYGVRAARRWWRHWPGDQPSGAA